MNDEIEKRAWILATHAIAAACLKAIGEPAIRELQSIGEQFDTHALPTQMPEELLVRVQELVEAAVANARLPPDPNT